MTTTAISITEAKRRWGEIVSRVAYGGERIVLLYRGKPKAALVSIEDGRLLEMLDERESREAHRKEIEGQK
nr:type II toxin-antitoxin system Phd/YefM family antitoxin [Anaerolineae bacterium]